MKVARLMLIVGSILFSLVTTAQPAPAVLASSAGRGHPTSTSNSMAVMLGAPTLISPAKGAFVRPNPTLVWSSVSGAARYHLQLAGGTYFDQQANFIDNWNVTSTSYYMSAHPEAYFKHVYWRVQAISANNVQGPWSAVSDFTIVTP